MARPMQKRKQRSSRARVQTHNRARKPVVPTGNDVVARNWDKKLTLTQNYRNFGLVSRLKAPTGGVERTLTKPAKPQSKKHSFAILPTEARIVGETKVERDGDGRIVRVLRHGARNPLNDPLAQFDSDYEDNDEDANEEEHTRTEVVKTLEELANAPVVKRARHASEQEVQWLAALVQRHGEDLSAMVRDKRLNKMQQTEADIRRRLRKTFGEEWAQEAAEVAL